MNTKTLTAAALGLVAAGSLALSTGTASAGFKPHYALPFVAAAATLAAVSYAHSGPRQVCEPVYKNKKVWTSYGWQWQPVYVGQNCYYAY